jgi:hypothetical protein
VPVRFLVGPDNPFEAHSGAAAETEFHTEDGELTARASLRFSANGNSMVHHPKDMAIR